MAVFNYPLVPGQSEAPCVNKRWRTMALARRVKRLRVDLGERPYVRRVIPRSVIVQVQSVFTVKDIPRIQHSMGTGSDWRLSANCTLVCALVHNFISV